MKNNKIFLVFFATFFVLIIHDIARFKSANSQEKVKICLNSQLEVSYELKDSWVYICDKNQEKIFQQLKKNNHEEILNISAFGSFPTYAGFEGESTDIDSKIYNITPFDFKIIQASIITNIEPVINTIYQKTGMKVITLSGEKEKEAMTICQDKKPVEIFETETDNIYICIDNNENNFNDVDLTYIQKKKDNNSQIISIPANLTNNFSYETILNNDEKYLISYEGLETYKNNQRIKTQSVINIYLASPDKNHINSD